MVFLHLTAYHSQHIGLGRNIQHGGCLVQNQQLWPEQKAPGDGHPLGFPTGDLMRQMGQDLRLQSDFHKHVFRQRTLLPLGSKAVIADQFFEAAADFLAWIQRRIGLLIDHLNGKAQFPVIGRILRNKTLAVQQNLPSVRRADAAEDFGQRGFSDPAFSEYAADLTVWNIQRDILQNLFSVKSLIDLFHGDHSLQHHHSLSPCVLRGISARHRPKAAGQRR